MRLGQLSDSEFLRDAGLSALPAGKAQGLMSLLLAQFYCQRMFVSSTFYFEDLDRPEPRYGIANALRAILPVAGNVPLMMDSIVTGLPHVRSGALKGIAVSTAKRTPLAPDIPTVAESGIVGFEAFLWYGIVAPAQTPPDIVAQLAREIAAVMVLPDIRERLVALGSEPADSNPSSFAAFIRSESEKWGEIVRSSGVKAD